MREIEEDPVQAAMKYDMRFLKVAEIIQEYTPGSQLDADAIQDVQWALKLYADALKNIKEYQRDGYIFDLSESYHVLRDFYTHVEGYTLLVELHVEFELAIIFLSAMLSGHELEPEIKKLREERFSKMGGYFLSIVTSDPILH